MNDDEATGQDADGGWQRYEPAGMMRQIQKMQQDMQEAQKALETETVEVTVGGAADGWVITGHSARGSRSRSTRMPSTRLTTNGSTTCKT
ncbi:MAG: hypothetical protein HC834_06085 [Rhodospirillales bacterium]|nr:hypothetical protein [Rhodospirillales bacterium]